MQNAPILAMHYQIAIILVLAIARDALMEHYMFLATKYAAEFYFVAMHVRKNVTNLALIAKNLATINVVN